MLKGGKMARAQVTLSSGSHPPDFPDRKKNDGRKKRKTRKRKASGFTSRSCREKAGSLNHAATTTGLQKQTPHLLCCLLPQPTPCCHYVCLYAGLTVHAHRQGASASCAWQPSIRTERRTYICKISACGCRDKVWPYLSILTESKGDE